MNGQADSFSKTWLTSTLRWQAIPTILLTLFLISSCQTTYYTVWEKLGKEKRHLLKENVEKARQDQVDASEQFATVLENFKSLYGFDGGDLEDVYNKLREDYEDCEDRADAVRERMDKVERIAQDLFKEWESEIAMIKNVNLQAKSQASLQDTRKRFDRLQRSMEKAELSMDPVLSNFRDYVVYLKHNLNAQAISSLKSEVVDIEAEVGTLITEMNHSINEAESFINSM